MKRSTLVNDTLDSYIKALSSSEKTFQISIDSERETYLKNQFYPSLKFAKTISFTPYIFNSCSANCQFCSERTQRKGLTIDRSFWAKSLQYEQTLTDVLLRFKKHQLFLSISGMEPSERVDMLTDIGIATSIFEKLGGMFSEKVMYSNLSGFANDNNKEIAAIMSNLRLTRIEASRHHFDENLNQGIARFKREQNIQQNAIFQKVISQLSIHTPIRLTCVLQKSGICSATDVEKYVAWAKNMGIQDVVFRELSHLPDTFVPNQTYHYINSHRIKLIDILHKLNNSFKLIEIKRGYYYLSFKFSFQNQVDVSFEVSDYEEMIKQHQSHLIKKLILYPNGKLCTDWNTFQNI